MPRKSLFHHPKAIKRINVDKTIIKLFYKLTYFAVPEIYYKAKNTVPLLGDIMVKILSLV